MTFSNGANLVELRAMLGLRPMAEFDPATRSRVHDNLNGMFFEWDPKDAANYRQWARPYRQKGWEELVKWDGLELLGWHPA